jgi:hypothetical protein
MDDFEFQDQGGEDSSPLSSSDTELSDDKDSESQEPVNPSTVGEVGTPSVKQAKKSPPFDLQIKATLKITWEDLVSLACYIGKKVPFPHITLFIALYYIKNHV